MAAKRRGDRTRWRAVVLIEAVKAGCRLVLLRATGGRKVLTAPLPERDVIDEGGREADGVDEFDERFMKRDRSDAPVLNGKGLDHDHSSPDRPTSATWTMPRTGLSLPAPPKPDALSAYLVAKTLSPDALRPPSSLLPRLRSTRAQLGEVLYILRPLIYALAMQRWYNGGFSRGAGDSRGGRGSAGRGAAWRPALIGLGIEILARRLRSGGSAGAREGRTALEREEDGRRGWAMGWWALRGQVYREFTRCVLAVLPISFSCHWHIIPFLSILEAAFFVPLAVLLINSSPLPS